MQDSRRDFIILLLISAQVDSLPNATSIINYFLVRKQMSSAVTLTLNNRLIANNEIVSITITKQEPRLHWDCDPDRLYTIMMYDYDARPPPYLHWLVTNVSETSNGNDVAAYKPPNPPNHEIHTYTIEIFSQNRPIHHHVIHNRAGFDVGQFIEDHQLSSFGMTSFRTSQ